MKHTPAKQQQLFSLGASDDPQPEQTGTERTAPMNWHKGKHLRAERIVGFMPPHLHYVEPYFGGGAVLLARDPTRNWYDGAEDWNGASYQLGCSQVVNDVYGRLINFWHVLRDPEKFDQFVRCVQAKPITEVDGDACDAVAEDSIEDAVRFFVCARQSRQEQTAGLETIPKNRTPRQMNERASAWLNVVDGLPYVHERLKRVVILHENATSVIKKEDTPRTLFYIEPPDLHVTPLTTVDEPVEISEDDHVQLLESINRVQGKVMLLGYRSNLYDELLAGWRREEIKIDNTTDRRTTKSKAPESIWMNF